MSLCMRSTRRRRSRNPRESDVAGRTEVRQRDGRQAAQHERKGPARLGAHFKQVGQCAALTVAFLEEGNFIGQAGRMRMMTEVAAVHRPLEGAHRIPG